MDRYDDDAYERTYPDGSPMHECWNAGRTFAQRKPAKPPVPLRQETDIPHPEAVPDRNTKE